MARLPLASRQDLLDELDVIAYERERALHAKNVVDTDRLLNRLASLDEWEKDLRDQLADMPKEAHE